MIRLVPVAGMTGEAVSLPRLPAAIGSGEDADVVVAGIAPRHAVLFARDGEVVIVDSGSPEGTFVSGLRTEEVVLRDGDVIRLGAAGPELRFERARDQPLTAVAAAPLSQTMMLRVVRQTRRSLLGALAAVVVVAAALLAWSILQNRGLHREMAGLRDAVKRADVERSSLERGVAEERARAEAERAALERQLEGDRAREEELRAQIASGGGGEVRALKEELGATAARIATLESERAVGERIISAYGNGVCLIQGAYGFADTAGRALRHAKAEEEEEDDADPGMPSADGKGSPYTVEYYGTGFLVEEGGLVLTNRHVAEPWWNDATAAALETKGFQPRFVRLRAYFPRHGEAFPMTPERISDSADLALLRVSLGGRSIPVLPLETERSRAVAGQPVIVVGYPTGLEAILAKAETGMVKAILETQGTDSDRVTDALSEKGLIRPSTTQGHIGDITATDIVFDAPSAQGGSGGPVFNKHGQVIAVEYAVLPKFGGTSFGVPIAYALELMRPPARTRPRRP
jgi:S1-C subfamily serine protease